MTRTIGYVWHLRRLMAERGMFATTDLVPLLAGRGVSLSREQVYRLVTRIPERLSLTTLAALCDILGCSPGDLVEPVAPGRTGGGRPGRGTGRRGPRGRPGLAGPGSCPVPARTDDSGRGGERGEDVPGRPRAWSAQNPRCLSLVPQGHRRGPGRGGRPVADRRPGRRCGRRSRWSRRGATEPGGGAGSWRGRRCARRRCAAGGRPPGHRADRPRVHGVHGPRRARPAGAPAGP